MAATLDRRIDPLPTRESVMAQAREENFPVAGLVIGGDARRHLLAIYGFARLVDDIGDEAPGDRTVLLEQIADDLGRVFAATNANHPVLQALAPTVSECRLPEAPFRRLIAANLRDQRQSRYETFEDLLTYCQLSAAPVGELVLHVFGAATSERVALSDRVCAGLQVIEHLQDVGEDAARGRVYLPREDMLRTGCQEGDLVAGNAGPALRAVVELLAQRSGKLIGAGRPLLRGMPLRARLTLAGFVAGGRATLIALERAQYDVLAQRPRRTARTFCVALLRAMAGR